MDRQAILQRNYNRPGQVPPLLCPKCGSREDVSLNRIPLWQGGAAVTASITSVAQIQGARLTRYPSLAGYLIRA